MRYVLYVAAISLVKLPPSVFTTACARESQKEIVNLKLVDELAYLVRRRHIRVLLVNQILFDSHANRRVESFSVDSVIGRSLVQSHIERVNIGGAQIDRAFKFCGQLSGHLMRDYRLNGAVSHPTFDWQRASRNKTRRRALLVLRANDENIFSFLASGCRRLTS